MVEYIKQIAEELQEVSKKRDINAIELLSIFEAANEELARLDPRDFLPIAQHRFVKIRIMLKRIYASNLHIKATTISTFPARHGDEMLYCLDHYVGEGSRAEKRSFNFILDQELRTIIQRDYTELSLIVLPGGAWKSCVVIAGSILEAILYDVLTRDPAIKTKAETSAQAPLDRNKKPLSLDKNEWTLHHLIEVAADIKLLPPDRAKSIDQILRGYRNYVHPKKEIRIGYPCTEAEAFLSKGALDSVCNHFESIFS